jgi:HEAT repeat protein
MSGSLLYVIVAGVVVSTVLSCLAFAHSELILVQYYLSTYVDSESSDGQSHQWLADHPSLSVPLLVDKLHEDDPVVCKRSGELIAEIHRSHPDPTNPEDAQISLNLASMLQKQYSAFSLPGKLQAVRLAYDILEQHLGRWSPNVATALATAGQVVSDSLKDLNPQVQVCALEQLPRAWEWKGADKITKNLAEEWMIRWSQWAIERLHSESPKVRMAAARALHGTDHRSGDKDLIRLIHDSDRDVVRAALQTISEDNFDEFAEEDRIRLVELLQDNDEEFRLLAKKSLVGYGLSEEQVRVISLMKQPSPAERAKAADAIVSLVGVDRVQVIDELAKDSSPIVRLAAIRAATKIDHPSLREMIKQLSVDDPDADVRQACQTSMHATNNPSNIK